MIKSLFSSISLALRVVKNLLFRPFRIAASRISTRFSPIRLVNKLPGVAQKLPKILKSKPEKREDYFDWGTIYVAKSLVITVIILLIAVPLLIIFLIVPLFTSWFGVKDFVVADKALARYSGRVCVYFDDAYEQLQFEGRLKDGKAVEYGEEYYENGRLCYAGSFADDMYNGTGISYYEDGSVRYRGEFANDQFSGNGEYISEEDVTYIGTFVNGRLSGKGTMLIDDTAVYEGGFENNIFSGEGRLLHKNGTVYKSGLFSNGELNGNGMEYYEDGTLKYNGAFIEGLYSGSGLLYSEDGVKLYSGEFEMGRYSGQGTLYDEKGKKLYSGEFENGLFSGSGTLISDDGNVTEGNFTEGKLSGTVTRTYPNGLKYVGYIEGDKLCGMGSLTELVGSFGYTGDFQDDDIDYGALLSLDSNAVKELFTNELTQKIDSSCFYLSDDSYGITLKCDFAEAGGNTRVTAVASLPKLCDGVVIRSVTDISAPNAFQKGRADETLPAWVTEKYGIPADSVDCWAAMYDRAAVYFWTDKATGKLLIKTAEKTGGAITIPEDSETGETLAREDIIKLFEELGLDIKDFESLGF